MSEDRSPHLTWSDAGAPASGRFGDVYYSKEDGLAEARAVFLTGCGLPGAWRGRSRIVVGELGFGTGLNVAALIALWRREGPPNGRLHVFSVEGFPLTGEEAARALSAWPELGEEVAALIAAWPAPTPGFHRLDLPPDWRVTLDLAIGPVASMLSRWQGQADAWFLDGFAPATNPDMWSPTVLAGVAERSRPGARIATFTVAGAVRRGLTDAGFRVEKKPGHGRKRERLEATLPGTSPPETSCRRIAVVGAGIAGQATARALLALGAQPVLIDGEAPGAGASGFPAALVTPRLDVGDPGLAALFAQALERAAGLYDVIPGAVTARGVTQLEQTARDAARFRRIAEQTVWPHGAMRRLDASGASEALGETVGMGGLEIRGARVVAPAVIREAWMRGVEVLKAAVGGIDATPSGVRLIDAGGATILEAEAVILTAGWGTAVLAPELGLRPVRGQADWAEGVAAPAAAWGGYVVPTDGGALFGATHDRDRIDVVSDPADMRRNLATLASRLPTLARRVKASKLKSRAAIRATTPDRLPLAGRLGDRTWVIGGLGSRGFALAPLLAEHVAAQIMAAPSPLPIDLASRVDPSRLAERAHAAERST
ncbi:tRNA (5-methylaminomethyl-2-thiouridine)(34)-methyltransferase MnmD [Brevundimonas sp.]|uniref:tRNA (5-methylaminomethyl-2-thiouridine)(34)-methyltransferase MnmD n=1 Tax=Brevundimonas sp. TaxID=1871086 RepID=UPI002E12789B|nr:tRNA (5-methylaminomethyl-2-thiouridine)(34)-methyltransferase MnmD [Brevundimonas sp.]